MHPKGGCWAAAPPTQIEIKKKIADTMMSLVSCSLPAIEIG